MTLPAIIDKTQGSVFWQSQERDKKRPALDAPVASTSASSGHPPLRTVLELHLHLSSQISQALFASIQSAFSTAHPPSPITRPAWLPHSLAALPIWSLPPHKPPTTEALIPSLIAVHNSLDELMLRARTHRANVQRVQALSGQIAEMQSMKRNRIRALRDASAELRDLVGIGREELKSIERARQAPLSYTDVLAYAADLARNTSAPPGWSGGGFLGDAAEKALQAKRALQPPQQGQEAPIDGIEASISGEKASGDDSEAQKVSSSSPLAQQQVQQRDEGSDDGGTRGGTPSHSGTPRTTAVLAEQGKIGTSHDGIDHSREADPESPRAAAAAAAAAAAEAEVTSTEQPTRRLPNLDDKASSAASAPHSLPFPSDADMRRGLMGVAMLEEQQQQDHAVAVGQTYSPGSAISVVLPGWNEFLVHFAAQHGQTLPPPPVEGGEQQHSHAQRTQAGVLGNHVGGVDAMEEEGFGLDL